MIHTVSLGACPRCRGELVCPSFSPGRVNPRCPVCDGGVPALLGEARSFVREVYGTHGERDLCLALGAYAGQYVAALISGDRPAARAFLANAVALGEILLAIPGDGT